MSSPDPEPPDVPSPPNKPRARAMRVTRDTSDEDLWDFDPDSAKSDPEVEKIEPAPEPEAQKLPKSKAKAPKSVERTPRPLPATRHGDEPATRKSAVGDRTNRASEPARRVRPHDDIGELDDSQGAWEEPEPPAPAKAKPAPTPAEIILPPSTIDAEIITPETTRDEVDLTDELAETVSIPIDHRPIRERIGLSKLERVGLGVLAAALLGTGIFLLTTTFGRMPTRSDSAEKPSFPVKGSFIRILDANSYWREPVHSGPGAETVRRETKLIPVLTLDLDGSPCAIRAFFRDDKGDFIGDGVTRAVSTGKIEIPATAGLDDIGAHAAYRTGETKPWKIEIFEAPSVNSPRQEFKKLLEIPISTDRR